MRKGILGTAALLAAARVAAAQPPQLPPALPPAPLAIAAEPAAPAQAPAAGQQPGPEVLPPPATTQPAAPAPTAIAPCTTAPTTAGPAGAPGQPRFHDDHCGPPEQAWLSGGPLLWWLKGTPTPVLATSSTGEVIGGNDITHGTYNGGRLDGGFWLDCRHTIGVTLGGFMLEQRRTVNGLFSDPTGTPRIARPVIDVLTLSQADVLVSAPGALAGSVAVASSARLAGAEAGLVHNLFYTRDYSIDVNFGFRYLDLDENLDIVQSTQALANGRLTIGNTPVSAVVLEDRFNTRNQFYGGQMGMQGEYRLGPLFADVFSKVALGPNHEVVSISGSTRDATGAVALPGGLLALQGGNIGRFVTNRFVVVPEVGAQVGVQLSSHVRVAAGYQFLYINDVARPGTQIDPAINPRLVPISGAFGTLSGQTSPLLTLHRDDFFAHGVQFLLDIRY
jgi:hypothetical protein